MREEDNMKIKLLAAVLVAVLSLTSCASTQGATGSAKPAKVVIGYQEMPNDETIVRTEGWYKQALGVPVELKEFDSGQDVNTAFASGSIDIGLIGTAPIAIGISASIPYQVFWIHDIIGTAESLAVKGNENITSVKDLKGKKIATPFASTSHYSLLNAIRLAGLSEKDVTVLDMQPDAIYSAWQRGDIDGAYVWQPSLGKLLSDGGKSITDGTQLAKQGVVTADLGVVSKKFAERYPNIMTKYVKLQQKAIELYRNSPNGAADQIAKGLGISQPDALAQAKQLLWLLPSEQTGSDYLGTIASRGKMANTLEDTAQFLVKQKSIPTAASLEQFKQAINPKFIEAASK